MSDEESGDSDPPSADDLDYGVSLPAIQRHDGELQPTDHVYEYKGEWQKIAVEQVTLGKQRWVEQNFEGRDDVEVDEMLELVDMFLEKPQIEDWDSQTIDEIMGYVQGITSYVLEGNDEDEFMDELEEELEARREDGGN